MPMTLPAELAALPAPSMVEEIGYEARLQALRDKLVEIFSDAGIDYDVDNLETDPAQILLQVAAYQDTLLRQRINEAVRSTFLAYATGGDLDILAHWYDVFRLPGEADDRLRERIVVSIQGRSPGGTQARYKSIAMAADVRVFDVTVYTEGRDPTVRVAVFSTEMGGIASPSLLAVVNDAMQDPEVRMVNDVIVVASAAQQAVNIVADLWLLPEAPESRIADARQNLIDNWTQLTLGRDVTLSWLIAQLQIDGVHRVVIEEPMADIDIPFDQAAGLGTITLTNRGRAF